MSLIEHNKWRIPEATLLILVVIGGGIGAWTYDLH